MIHESVVLATDRYILYIYYV